MKINFTFKMQLIEDLSKRLKQMGKNAPIFQSDAGGTAFTDGTTGCYVGLGTMPPNGNAFYDGDHIVLFYNGVGIVLEYYH